MPEFDRLPDKARRTRRNFVEMAAIGASVAIAALHRSAHAAQDAQCGGYNTYDYEPCPHCFLKGMRVRTANGDRAIQDLRVGDRIPTVFGGTRPIRRLASYSCRKSDPSQPWDRRVLPVRIAPSALAPGVPQADLYLTRGHSLLIDGILFPAGSLINGMTITWYEARELDELEFFHIEFDSHDALYVEGVPCESLLGSDPKAENAPGRPGFRLHRKALCAPLGFNGGRSELTSRLRSALSPWFECRRPVDIIRDALDARAGVVTRERRCAVGEPGVIA